MTQKYHKGFTKIGKILPNTIKQYKLEKSFYRHQALKHWETVAGKFFAEAREQVRAIDLKNGILTVACLSKDLAYEIKLLAKRIVDELNKLIGKLVVFAIHVEI